MTLSQHSIVGIVETVAYIPIVPLCIWQAHRNWDKTPRSAWISLVVFSLIRLAGGPIVVEYENNENSLALAITAQVLLSVGILPLVYTWLGRTQLILHDSINPNNFLQRFVHLLRLAFLASVGLLVAGGTMSGNPTNSDATRSQGRSLTNIGYAILTVLMVLLSIYTLILVGQRRNMTPGNKRIHSGLLFVIPFVYCRDLYGILHLANDSSTTTIWNPLTGSAPLFAIMGLLPEYIAVIIYLWAGLTMERKSYAAEDVGLIANMPGYGPQDPLRPAPIGSYPASSRPRNYAAYGPPVEQDYGYGGHSDV